MSWVCELACAFIVEVEVLTVMSKFVIEHGCLYAHNGRGFERLIQTQLIREQALFRPRVIKSVVSEGLSPELHFVKILD